MSFYSYLISMLGGANIATMLLWSLLIVLGQRVEPYPGADRRPIHRMRWWMMLLSVSIILIYIYYMAVVSGRLYTSQRALALSHSLEMLVLPMCAMLVSYVSHTFKVERIFVLANFVPFVLLGVANQLFCCDRMMDVAFAYTAMYFVLGVFVFTLGTVRYEKQLKDLFASTDGRSLYWMWGVLILAILQGLAWWCYIYFFSPLAVSIYYAFSLLNWNYIFFNLYRMLIRTEASMTPEPEVQPMLNAILEPIQEGEDDVKQNEEFLEQLQQVCVADDLYQNDELNRDMLAKKMNMNHTRLTTLLHQTTGKTFYEYINTLRVEKACELLCETERSIEQVAFDVGYRHRSTFYRAFVSEMGLTPTEYRKQRAHAGA